MSHKCLCCGHQTRDDNEELVPGTGVKGPVRYMHADYTGCQEAMAEPRTPRQPRPETTRPRRTLSQIESVPDHGHWKKI